jgi:hypothetical protein
MSQYKISKKRLAQLIKEEYQSLREDSWSDKGTGNALTRNIDRWSEEGRDIPLDRTVGRADRSDQLDAILDATSTDLGRLQDVVSYFVMKAGAADVQKWLDERGLMGGPGASAYNRKDETKKAKEDFDGDGEVESSEEEWKGSRNKAIKKAVKKESLDSIRDLIQQELQNL